MNLLSLIPVALTLGLFYAFAMALQNVEYSPGDKLVSCVSCEDTVWETKAKDRGWQFATMHDGEPNWMCLDCARTEVEGERRNARWA